MTHVIQKDEGEEVIVCSWDGQTYIVNSKQQIAKFQFDEPTAAFVAGKPTKLWITSVCIFHDHHMGCSAQIRTTSLVIMCIQ